MGRCQGLVCGGCPGTTETCLVSGGQGASSFLKSAEVGVVYRLIILWTCLYWHSEWHCQGLVCPWCPGGPIRCLLSGGQGANSFLKSAVVGVGHRPTVDWDLGEGSYCGLAYSDIMKPANQRMWSCQLACSHESGKQACPCIGKTRE